MLKVVYHSTEDGGVDVCPSASTYVMPQRAEDEATRRPNVARAHRPRRIEGKERRSVGGATGRAQARGAPPNDWPRSVGRPGASDRRTCPRRDWARRIDLISGAGTNTEATPSSIRIAWRRHNAKVLLQSDQGAAVVERNYGGRFVSSNVRYAAPSGRRAREKPEPRPGGSPAAMRRR